MKSPHLIWQMQRQAELDSALRAGKSGTKLLDDNENNLGNATRAEPQALPPGQLFTVVPQATVINSRLLNLTATSKSAQSVTIVMTASLTQENQGLAGPITGIVEFGNGTQNTTISFDVPIGPYIGNVGGGVVSNNQPQDSGAVLQVPSSIVRAYFRYDNAFVTPEVGGYAFGAADSPNPVPPGSGPFSPNFQLSTPPSPLNVKAFAAYFGRHHTKLYKTQYLYAGNVGAPVPFLTNNGSLVPTFYCIPPFAKSVRLIRSPFSAAMVVELWNQVSGGDRTDAHYEIPANTNSPIMPIEGNMNIITIASKTAAPADAVYAVRLVYEIGF